MKRTPLITTRLSDGDTDRVVRSHAEAIKELQGTAMPSVVTDVVLVDGVITPVAHRLGRKPSFVWPSAIRGATSTGRIEEVRDGQHDRAKVVALKASGWGATISIDLGVL